VNGILKVFLRTKLGRALCCYWIEGESLRHVVINQGRLKLSVVSKYYFCLLSILKKVHSRGIFHLDVTPSNIIVGKMGKCI
jgi:serine/threonine protein kinase